MNYCKDCKYLRTRIRYTWESLRGEGEPILEKIPPYIPGEKREYFNDFICSLLSEDISSYSNEKLGIKPVDSKKNEEALGIAFPDCNDFISCNFIIEQQDKFGCNLFKKKGNKL